MTRRHAEDQALVVLDTRLHAAIRLHRLSWAGDPLYRIQRRHDGSNHRDRIANALAEATAALGGGS